MITYLANPVRAALPAMQQRADLGVIITPNQGNRLPADVPWCADNGCGPGKHGIGAGYPGARGYLEFLSRMSARARTRCLFAVAPDVVCDSPASLARLDKFYAAMRGWFGLPVAMAAQDGLEVADVPWHSFDVLFVGGSTEWKLGGQARELVRVARLEGKRVHMGRVNSGKRLAYAAAIGCDSADGTFLTFGPDANLPRLLGWLDDVNRPQQQLQLFAA